MAYIWPDATPDDEAKFYFATCRLLNGPVAQVVFDALRDGDPAFPLFVAGTVATNYYLVNCGGRAVPSNDINVKVSVGVPVREAIQAAGGLAKDWNGAKDQSESCERAQASFDKVIREFVEYALLHMEQVKDALLKVQPTIAAALKPLGVSFADDAEGPVIMHHKTHTDPPQRLNLVPLSGGVFQVVVRLRKDGASFSWNILDFEADWKSVHNRGDFTKLIKQQGVTPTEMVNSKPDGSCNWHLNGLHVPTQEWMRKDLGIKCQPAKEERRHLRRVYWDEVMKS